MSLPHTSQKPNHRRSPQTPYTIAILLTLVLSLLTPPALAITPTPSHRPNRILIQLKPTTTPTQIAALHSQTKSQTHRDYPHLNRLQVVTLPPNLPPEAAISHYLNSGLVELAEPDILLQSTLTPNDPAYANGNQWGLHNIGQSGGLINADINAPEAWDGITTAPNIIVAVIDSGVRYTHIDLANNMWINPGEIPNNGIDDDRNGFVDDVHGMNAVDTNGDPVDVTGHGTLVSGIIGASTNNRLGMAGICWDVQIMACRFISDTGEGSLSDAIECIDYATSMGAHVINASWGSPSYSSFLENSIRRARDAGILFIAASGNDGLDADANPFYPASFTLDNILSVTATTSTDLLASYANYGASSVDLAAPGSSIYSTYFTSDSGYSYASGTSLAAPFVAGTAALMLTRYPTESYGQIRTRILATTDPLPSLTGKCTTGGRLNLATALGPSLVADFTASPPSGNVPLTVQFTDQSYGDITSYNWSFGDGSPYSTEQNPTHTYALPGNYTATLTVENSSGSTSSKSRSIPVVANYSMSTTTYNWIDHTGMTDLSLNNNSISPALTLPFNFTFYGQSYSQLYVSANGLLGFLPDNLATSANTDLPNPGSPNAILAPYWDSLSPDAGGSILYGTIGSAPNRQVVVTWNNIRYASKQPVNLTFQTVLNEANHSITFQYADVATGKSQGEGLRATIGIENETGLVAQKYGYNGSQLVANNQAILFSPPAIAGMTLSPSTDLTASGPTSGPFTPNSTTYTLENTGNTTLSWSTSHNATWLALTPSSGTLNPGQTSTITASINAYATTLSAGTYRDTITFANANNGLGNTTRTATLTINGTTPILEVSPESPVNISGVTGGVFVPNTILYTLMNTGDATMDWSATPSDPWLSLSQSSGSLAPGEGTTLQISLNDTANALPPGSHTNTLSFVNLTNNEGSTSRLVTLTVNTTPTTSISPSFQTENNSLTLLISGSPNQSLTLQSSTNLTSWTTLTNITLDPTGSTSISLPTTNHLSAFRTLTP
jgi:subtilisin family serine protease